MKRKLSARNKPQARFSEQVKESAMKEVTEWLEGFDIEYYKAALTAEELVHRAIQIFISKISSTAPDVYGGEKSKIELIAFNAKKLAEKYDSEGELDDLIEKGENKSNYKKILAYLLKEETKFSLARKAARFVVDEARNSQSWESVATKFAERHHNFIREIFLAEIEQEKDLDRKIELAENNVSSCEDEFTKVWEALDVYSDAPLKGSPKQIKWATSLKSYAIERWLAPAVVGGEMQFEEAVTILKNPDVKYWIDNREDWGC